jgi:hypothetical protein
LAASFTALEPFSEPEAELVDLARATPLVRDLRKRLDYWLDQVATDDQALDRSRVRDVRALNMRRDGEMIRVSGWFDIEAGERVRAHSNLVHPPRETIGPRRPDEPTSSSTFSTGRCPPFRKGGPTERQQGRGGFSRDASAVAPLVRPEVGRSPRFAGGQRMPNPNR